MCGILGFALEQSMPIAEVFRVLERLERHQYPEEPKPVGGYGAGVAILKHDGRVVSEKVGKVGESPARSLRETINIGEASVLIGHVRMPSPEFVATAKFKETAQPYIVRRDLGLTIASVHNGKVENYRELRLALGKGHVFESESIELIDSEVIPHTFERLLREKQDPHEALDSLFCALQGPSAIALLQVDRKNSFFHIIHKGKTRGLTIWENGRKELVFCTRKEPLLQEFHDILSKGKFKEKISIAVGEDVGLKLSYPLPLE